jgi:hypothetical protein
MNQSRTNTAIAKQMPAAPTSLVKISPALDNLLDTVRRAAIRAAIRSLNDLTHNRIAEPADLIHSNRMSVSNLGESSKSRTSSVRRPDDTCKRRIECRLAAAFGDAAGLGFDLVSWQWSVAIRQSPADRRPLHGK